MRTEKSFISKISQYTQRYYLSSRTFTQVHVHLQDLLGLKSLNETGRLRFDTLPNEHMHISIDDLKSLVDKHWRYSSHPRFVVQN